MDANTLRFYNDGADALAARYESVTMTETHRLLLAHLPPGGPILEIGCGSGRDAAFLLARGYAVTAMDAAPAMLAAATRHHPELTGRLIHAALPLADDAALFRQTFAAVICLATLMHVPDADLPLCASQIRRLLKPGGILFLSLSSGRAVGRAADGRLFYERPAAAIQARLEVQGFRLVALHESADAFARPIRWHSLVFRAV